MGLSRLQTILALVTLGGCGRLGFAELTAGGDAGGGDAAPRANYAFVTKGRYAGALGGVSGADAVCASEGAAAGIPGDYVALLWSTERPDPATALVGSRGWQLPSGEWLADTPADVATGAYFHPLNAFPSGARVDGNSTQDLRFWTGQIEGTCDDWRSASTVGDQAYIPQRSRLSDGRLGCAGPYRLACFERGHAVTPALPPITHKRLFVTAATWTPGGGVASADQLCDDEASTSGIGTSRALLPTDVSAAQRTGAGATVYQQPDGILFGTLAASDSYLIVGADRRPHDGPLWTGGDPLQVPEETCAGWTSAASGQHAIIGVTAWGGFGDINDLTTCDRAAHLVCVEM